MMRSHKKQTLTLVAVLGVVALVAQLAGVGGTRSDSAKRTTAKRIATVANAAVPDLGSTTLASTKRTARAGDTLRMRSVASVRATKLPKGAPVQVVCGIRYSRTKDASWSLGVPYDLVVLKRVGARHRFVIDRSVTAPAVDTYKASVACHVASPAKGAAVVANGTMRIETGLPKGAAKPLGN